MHAWSMAILEIAWFATINFIDFFSQVGFRKSSELSIRGIRNIVSVSGHYTNLPVIQIQKSLEGSCKISSRRPEVIISMIGANRTMKIVETTGEPFFRNLVEMRNKSATQRYATNSNQVSSAAGKTCFILFSFVTLLGHLPHRTIAATTDDCQVNHAENYEFTYCEGSNCTSIPNGVNLTAFNSSCVKSGGLSLYRREELDCSYGNLNVTEIFTFDTCVVGSTCNASTGPIEINLTSIGTPPYGCVVDKTKEVRTSSSSLIATGPFGRSVTVTDDPYCIYKKVETGVPTISPARGPTSKNGTSSATSGIMTATGMILLLSVGALVGVTI